MSGAHIDRAEIQDLLERHHRPLSARRLLVLSQQELGYEVNYGVMLTSLKKWAKSQEPLNHRTIIEIRRGVFTLSEAPSLERPAQTFDEDQVSTVKVEKRGKRIQPSPTSSSQQKRSTEKEMRVLRTKDGKEYPHAEITRAHLENAERISAYLIPYPVSPSSVRDVLTAEEHLLGNVDQMMWQRLLEEREALNDALALGLPTVRLKSIEDESIEDQCKTILKTREQWIKLEELCDLLCAHPKLNSIKDSQRKRWLRQRLESINIDTERKGERPPFLFSENGEVFLSDLSQGLELLNIERQLSTLADAHKSMIRKYLLEKISALSIDAFESLLLSYLERSAYHSIESLNRREDERIAILAQHHQLGSTLVIAHRSSEPLTIAQLDQLSRGLSSLNVERGEVIHLGGFEIQCDKRNNLNLIDGEQLTSLLLEKEVGVKRYYAPHYFLDPSWFEQLTT